MKQICLFIVLCLLFTLTSCSSVDKSSPDSSVSSGIRDNTIKNSTTASTTDNIETSNTTANATDNIETSNTIADATDNTETTGTSASTTDATCTTTTDHTGTTTATDSVDDGSIFFNDATESATTGKRLVEPFRVTETEFRSHYDISLSHINSNQYEIRYILEYVWDSKTNQADMSKLSNGWISVYDNHKLVFSMYISNKGYISKYLFKPVELKNSRLNGYSARFFDVSSPWRSSFLYGEIQTNNYFITCSMHDKTQAEMVQFLETLLENSTL